MKLTEVGLLVALNISQWTARKYDKKATHTVAEEHGVYDFVGRYNKSLLPMTQELQAVTNIGSAMRLAFYANTLPYTYEGVRLLPSKNYFDFVNLMNSYLDKWHAAVDVFVGGYSGHVANAEKMLGDLYSETEYPAVNEIKTKFRAELNISPVPDERNFYSVLAEDIADTHIAKYAKVMESTTQKAMQDCWERLYGIVKKFVERLADTGKSLREDHVQALLDNAREMCQLLEKLNITNDANFEALRQEVLDSLCLYNAAVLSGHELSKNEVRAKAQDIMRKMNGFMGVSANGN